MNKSFTLIEILVVIVVIGIISAFILVGMSSITSKANIAKSQAFLNSMDNSLLLGRVSQWKLDQVLGSSAPYTTSDAWNSNTGTLMDVDNVCSFSGTLKCPQPVTSGCVSSNCLSFDGTNDYISAPSTNFNYLTGTISFWAYLNTHKDYNFYFNERGTANNNNEIEIFSNTSGNLTGRVWGGTTENTTSTTISLSMWIHIVMAWNSSALRLYKNGITVDSDTSVTLPAVMGSTLVIGDSLNYNDALNGLVDDVRVYNQALSSSEINQNYYVGINKLFKNNGIVIKEYNQRLSELRESLSNK